MDRWRVRERIGEVRKRTDVPLHLHQLVVDVNNSARVSDRGYIVVCWLLILCWFGRAGGKVALMRRLIGRLLDVGERVGAEL
jgi:hypothetical protein